jgi:hypothetical protein
MERMILQTAIGIATGLAEERIVAPPVSYWQRLARAARGRVLSR